MTTTTTITPASPPPPPPPSNNKFRPFIAGGIAAMTGAAASHPLDVVKVRLQIEANKDLTAIRAFKLVYQQGGLRKGLFKGLSASVARQAVYSGIRFGLYDVFGALIKDLQGNGNLNVVGKVLAGLMAGGIGAAIANPLDLVLVRMQADGKAPPEQRRNYKHVIDGIIRVAREEGIKTLWVGSLPTVSRAMVITASQFAAYDSIKETILAMGWLSDGTPLHLTSGFLAGVVASITSTPFDTLKTRIMNDKPPPNNRYTGMLDCATKTIREPGGVFALYKGFVPTAVRQMPYVVVMFVTLEQVRGFWRWLDRVS